MPSDSAVPSAEVSGEHSYSDGGWDRLCSAEGGVVLEFDADEAGAWRQTHALIKLEQLVPATAYNTGVAMGQFVVSLKAVVEAGGSDTGLLQLSLPVRRHSQRVATVSCGARLVEPPLPPRTFS